MNPRNYNHNRWWKVAAFFNNAELLALLFPLLMIIPNIILDITDLMPWWMYIVNLLWPLSVYALATAWVRRIGVIIVCSLFFILLNCFQIVISYLFGEGIIAIDMFLNVATTSPGEASELLSNLILPIVGCILVYGFLVGWAVFATFKKLKTSDAFRRFTLLWAGSTLAFSTLILIIGLVCAGSFLPLRSLYPINVCSNIVTATTRFNQSLNYPETSKNFTYNATDTHPEHREIHVLVIGETSRSGHWQLGGYDRETNPRLSQRNDINFFPRAVSQSNTTHKCVPMIMTPLTAERFDSIIYYKSIITAFKEAGYHTAFFTTQAKNHSYNQYFAEEADNTVFLDNAKNTDMTLVDLLRDELSDTTRQKQFIVLHTYGSHFNYRDRYPDEYSHFTPDKCYNASSSNRETLVNAYDNTIRFTDAVLSEILETLDEQNAVATLVYASDHGEDIFDDSRNRFLHASPSPTYYQLHVPMLVWTSAEYDSIYPEAEPVIADHLNSFVAPPHSIFHTIIDLSGISTPKFNPRSSLASPTYTEPEALYINDYNEAVPLDESGIKDFDRTMFRDVL